MNQPSNRREFLKGRSLVQAARQALENFEFDVPDLNLDVSETKQAAYLETYEKRAMACTWELMFNMQQYRESGLAAAKAMQLIDELESQLTVYQDDSEVSQMNQNAFREPFVVSEPLFHLLQRAQAIHESTAGAFDVTAGKLSQVWGFEQRSGSVPGEETLAETLNSIGMQHLVLDNASNSVRFAVPNLKVNLGGIGKGYAIDRVAAKIREHEVHDFVLHGGQSSVIAAGNQKDITSDSGSGWPVGLSHPVLPDRRLAEFYLRDAALGTSGTARQGFFHQGKRFGHIIHPKTGWPTDHFLSTTVISNSAELSDALATAFFVMPIESVEEFCRQHTDVRAVLVSDNPGGDKSRVQLDWFNIDDADWKRV
ncbi:FAD:protein FMN transferase [Mariniblastus fucicola]|uniref:FAD:protein FMN transferase n=1 Tax=Mariniblastus fucicola TaxID=980251 RepID=A0A5B9P435_9BACT|nr:FAD:protein FMN transferase [Mariniblastus fucicola]QEG21377.1 Thiamine biosynthesis lipoprotein ApbE precursor [Mariniblastus fucicola]